MGIDPVVGEMNNTSHNTLYKINSYQWPQSKKSDGGDGSPSSQEHNEVPSRSAMIRNELTSSNCPNLHSKFGTSPTNKNSNSLYCFIVVPIRHCLMFDHTIRKRMEYNEFTYVSVSVGISNHLIATI